MDRRPVRFICVMPSLDFTDVMQKRTLLKQVANEFGYTAVFPTYDKSKPDFSLNDTIGHFRQSDFVFVDLSDERPSCYFELGIAESVGAKVIAVAKNGTPIHQTSHRDAVAFFDSLKAFEATLREKFEAIS